VVCIIGIVVAPPQPKAHAAVGQGPD
jgi:hypothetical protein